MTCGPSITQHRQPVSRVKNSDGDSACLFPSKLAQLCQAPLICEIAEMLRLNYVATQSSTNLPLRASRQTVRMHRPARRSPGFYIMPDDGASVRQIKKELRTQELPHAFLAERTYVALAPPLSNRRD